ncbi:MAG: prefoldin subunit alpha [Thermoplasmata archaeon]|nr:MAG: prefoldin subunit alpha [Thermoplasmata archaeon]
MEKGSEIERYVVALEAYKAQAEALAKDLEVVRANIENLMLAKLTLQNCAKAGENNDILIPIGGAAYVRGGLRDTKTAIVSIGSGVFVEESVEDCVKRLDKRIEALKEAEKSVQEKIRALQKEAERVSAKIEEVYRSAGGQ